MPRTCRCGNPIPEHQGPGRPRTKCDECSPSRNRPRIAVLPDRPKVDSPLVVRTREDLGDLADTAEGMIVIQLAEAIAAGGGTAAGLVRLSERYDVAKRALLASGEDDDADVVEWGVGT